MQQPCIINDGSGLATQWYLDRACEQFGVWSFPASNIEALIIRIGLWGHYIVTIRRNPQNSISNYLGPCIRCRVCSVLQSTVGSRVAAVHRCAAARTGSALALDVGFSEQLCSSFVQVT